MYPFPHLYPPLRVLARGPKLMVSPSSLKCVARGRCRWQTRPQRPPLVWLAHPIGCSYKQQNYFNLYDRFICQYVFLLIWSSLAGVSSKCAAVFCFCFMAQVKSRIYLQKMTAPRHMKAPTWMISGTIYFFSIFNAFMLCFDVTHSVCLSM